MTNILKLLFCSVLCLVPAPVALYAQPPAPPPPKAAPARVVGKAEVYWFPKRNQTSAAVSVYLLGTTADIYKKKDVLTLYARYAVIGPKAVQPAKVAFSFGCFSPAHKCADDHMLTLIADGKTILTTEVPLSHSFSTSSEYYEGPIDYEVFRTFANAKKATLMFAKTTVEFTPEMSQALKDLDATIER